MIVNAPVPPQFGTGLVKRNFRTHPQGYLACAKSFPNELILPESEWAPRLARQQTDRSGLLDMRNANYDVLKSLDQNGYGLCWSFSSTKAVMYVRALMNEPGIRLSAYYVAGQINRWADRGGWGASSLDFITKNGVPSADKCPKYSPSSVTSDAAENALLHKVTEWWDGDEDSGVAQRQMVSMLLQSIPCVVDLDVMGHSMAAIAIKSLDPLTIIYDNSWGEQGDHGLYVGTGAYARPNGLVIPRVSVASLS